jgi:hypothetical protein
MMMNTLQLSIQQLIWLAGVGQVALALGSLAIPTVLQWKVELAKPQPLIGQMFWTYAGYIFVINVCFGLLSIFDYKELTNGSRLAMLVTGFIAAYWISRVLIQFLYFDRSNFPTGKLHKLGEAMLIAAFVFFSLIYSRVCYLNYIQLS